MNDDEITLKENEDRRRIMREQSEHISKLGAENIKLRKACRLALSKSDKVNIRRRAWQAIFLDVRAILEAALGEGGG